MAPGISLRFLLRSSHGCWPQLEVLWTVRRGGPRSDTQMWSDFNASVQLSARPLCVSPSIHCLCAEAEVPSVGDRNSDEMWEGSTFPQREFHHTGESLHMSCTYAESIFVHDYSL